MASKTPTTAVTSATRRNVTATTRRGPTTSTFQTEEGRMSTTM
ncbi:UNVERIFIED_CONTAM: hypothetical protein GTU68_054326 [Idotea baltica]|nr:hypothetical protein [Idotea baltica]